MMNVFIQEFPKQLKVAVEIGAQATLSKHNQPIHNIVVLGMGGSGIGGEFVAEFVRDTCSVPFLSCKGYKLPAYIGKTNALRNVFKYLLDNAIQAVIESGHDYRFICVQTAIDNHELVIQISDTGVGIAVAHQHKMFEPFFCGWQHNKSHAGLGLTMAQEIVNDHGGSLTLDPDYISGCRMIVRLPLGEIS